MEIDAKIALEEAMVRINNLNQEIVLEKAIRKQIEMAYEEKIKELELQIEELKK